MSMGEHRRNGRKDFFTPAGETTVITPGQEPGPMGQLPDEEPTRALFTQEEAGVIEGKTGEEMDFNPRLPSGAYPYPPASPASPEQLAALKEKLTNERPEVLPSEPQVTSFNPAPGNVDVAEFLSCMAEFIEEQTRFLEHGRGLKGEQYVNALTLYSKAQGKLLKAQKDVLKQLGVI